jgi:hypothetical protein
MSSGRETVVREDDMKSQEDEKRGDTVFPKDFLNRIFFMTTLEDNMEGSENFRFLHVLCLSNKFVSLEDS